MVVLDLILVLPTAVLALSARGNASTGWNPRAFKWISVSLLAFGGLLLAVMFIINAFFFSDSIRYVLNQVGSKTSIQTSCDFISGDLFEGVVTLKDCSITRSEPGVTDFELTLRQLVLDVELMSLFGTATLQSAVIDGLKGRIHAVASMPSQTSNAPSRQERPRRAFEITELDVTDLQLQMSGENRDGQPFELAVDIPTLSSKPFRSRYALFDALFRSNAHGNIADSAFTIQSGIVDGKNRTAWRADHIPVATLGAMIGGTLSWFSEGRVDVLVEDEWRTEEGLSIDMDWNLNFHELVVETPAGAGPIKTILTRPLVNYVNGLGGSFPLQFKLVLDEDRFEYQPSLAAAGFMDAVGTGVGEGIDALLKSVDVKLIDQDKSTSDKIKDGASSLLDRLRKRNKETSEAN